MKATKYLFIILFFSCQHLFGQVEENVINDLLLEIYGTNYYHVPFNSIYQFDSLKQEELLEQYIVDKNRPIDQRDLFLTIHDTLKFPNYETDRIRKVLDLVSENDSFLLENLIRNNDDIRLIEIKKISNTGRYKLNLTSQYKGGIYFKENADKIKDVGVARFSKISLDNNKTYGCFFYESVEAGGHGGGSILYFVKLEFNVWKIIKKIRL